MQLHISVGIEITLKLLGTYKMILYQYEQYLNGEYIFICVCLFSFDITNFMAKLISLCILLNSGWAFDWCIHKYRWKWWRLLPCVFQKIFWDVFGSISKYEMIHGNYKKGFLFVKIFAWQWLINFITFCHFIYLWDANIVVGIFITRFHDVYALILVDSEK